MFYGSCMCNAVVLYVVLLLLANKDIYIHKPYPHFVIAFFASILITKISFSQNVLKHSIACGLELYL